MYNAGAVAGRIDRVGQVPDIGCLKTAVGDALLALAHNVVPHTGSRGHMGNDPLRRRRRDGYAADVGIVGRAAQVDPGVSAVDGAVEAVLIAGHKLSTERGEERAIGSVGGRNSQMTWIGFIETGQTGGCECPRGAAVAGTEDSTFGCVVPGCFD